MGWAEPAGGDAESPAAPEGGRTAGSRARGDGQEPLGGARPADIRTVEALRRHDFQGPAWDVFIGMLQQECRGPVEAWIRDGRMLDRAKRMGRAVTALSPALRELLRHDEIARYDLAQDALLAGARVLHKVLKDGRWDPQRSSLKTTFVNMVILQFSTVAKAWAASQEYREHEDMGEDLPDPPALGAADQFTAAENWADLDARFRGEGETVRAMIRLRGMGRAPKDIATELGLPYRSAEGIWRRFTTKARDQGSDGRPA
ncbi:hypothetical protein [Streptomyces aureoversilis]|uniref:Sigma-70 family RNA polymerase sigma factor n=1 Tax=Streptomyces aureoversilis TaxID=67277 RepID=A0ABV9ZZ06_9ACTN